MVDTFYLDQESLEALGWPDHYQEKNFIESICDWSIESRDKNNMIQVNFFGISLTSIDYLERFDTLKMKGLKYFLINHKTLLQFS